MVLAGIYTLFSVFASLAGQSSALMEQASTLEKDFGLKAYLNKNPHIPFPVVVTDSGLQRSIGMIEGPSLSSRYRMRILENSAGLYLNVQHRKKSISLFFFGMSHAEVRDWLNSQRRPASEMAKPNPLQKSGSFEENLSYAFASLVPNCGEQTLAALKKSSQDTGSSLRKAGQSLAYLATEPAQWIRNTQMQWKAVRSALKRLPAQLVHAGKDYLESPTDEKLRRLQSIKVNCEQMPGMAMAVLGGIPMRGAQGVEEFTQASLRGSRLAYESLDEYLGKLGALEERLAKAQARPQSVGSFENWEDLKKEIDEMIDLPLEEREHRIASLEKKLTDYESSLKTTDLKSATNLSNSIDIPDLPALFQSGSLEKIQGRIAVGKFQGNTLYAEFSPKLLKSIGPEQKEIFSKMLRTFQISLESSPMDGFHLRKIKFQGHPGKNALFEVRALGSSHYRLLGCASGSVYTFHILENVPVRAEKFMSKYQKLCD